MFEKLFVFMSLAIASPVIFEDGGDEAPSQEDETDQIGRNAKMGEGDK